MLHTLPQQNTMSLLAKLCVFISAEISRNFPFTRPIGPHLQKWQEATRTPSEVFCCVSFYEVTTITMITIKEWQGVQIPSSIIHCLLGCLYSLTSYILSHVSLAKYPFTCVYFRKTFLRAWFSKTSYYLCAPAKHHLT